MMENMPPKEMWILCRGKHITKYYRTRTQIVRMVKENHPSRVSAIWYCDFEAMYPHWELLEVKDYPK